MGKKNKKKKGQVDGVVFEIENVEKEEKEKKPNVVVEKFNLYKFIIKILAAAILLTFGILILVKQQQAVFAIMFCTAVVVLLAALIRVIPLIRTLKTKEAKVISFCEICLHFALGAYLIFAAFNYLSAEPNDAGEITGFAHFNEVAYPYFLSFILYSRAVAYFWVTVLHREDTDKIKFWLHIICITLSVVIAALGQKLDAKTIAIALAVIALVCAVVIGGESATGYFRYRKQVSAPKQKEKDKKKEEGLELPQQDNDVINEIDPNIIPVDDNNNQDSNIVS